MQRWRWYYDHNDVAALTDAQGVLISSMEGRVDACSRLEALRRVVCTLLSKSSADWFLFGVSRQRAVERGEEQLSEAWVADLLARADGYGQTDDFTLGSEACGVGMGNGVVTDTVEILEEGVDDWEETTPVAPADMPLPLRFDRADDFT
jgi:hypothetical protein